MNTEVPPHDPLELGLQTAINRHGVPTRIIPAGFTLYRVQGTHYLEAVFYNRNSNSRYGDLRCEIGVCYVACSDNVAVAETLQNGQQGPDSALAQSDIEGLSLHRLAAARALTLVDTASLAVNTGIKLDSLVQTKGHGEEGYRYTRALSSVCMRQGEHIDGLLYPSRAYPTTADIRGCNVVLFEGRLRQLRAINKEPLFAVELSSGEVVVEFLERIHVLLV